MDDEQRTAWLRLSRVERVGPVTFRELINHYGTAAAALDALPDIASRASRRSLRIPERSAIEAEVERLHRFGGRLICSGEPHYPRALEAYDAAPMVIQVVGRPEAWTRPTVGVVGSRRASMASAKFTMQIAEELSRSGYAIASGFARGIDTAAHRASTSHGTIAVFAGGIDHVYPPENEPLAHEIVDGGGAIVSEMPFGWKPRAKDFPRRNRIIAGMSLGVIVVEAALRSGSLITARLANEMGREVFAVPGSPLDPRSEGANSLLKQGANLCLSATDVFEHLAGAVAEPEPRLEAPPSAPVVPIEPNEGDRARLIGALDRTPVDLDELVRFTGLEPRAVQYILLELDLAGRIVRHPGNRVSLS